MRLRPSLLLICLAAALLGTVSLSADSVIVKQALSLRASSSGEQRLRNGDLELSSDAGLLAWEPYRLGYEVDSTTSHSGRQSARCHNASPDEHRGLSYVVELDQQRPLPITAECWSKAEDVGPGAAGDYSLYLDLEFTDGTTLWGQIAPFDPGTHDWQRRVVTLFPPKPVRSVALYALLRARTGTAWFDDLALAEIELPNGISFFDRVSVTDPLTSEESTMSGPTLETEDGFQLRFDSVHGDIVTTAPGGLSLRDVAAESNFVHPRGALRLRPDGAILRRGRDDRLGLEISASYPVAGSVIRIDGEVRDLTNTDRAVTVYFTYPIDATGWRWHDDQRTARLIEPAGEYDNLVTTGAGANGLASRYPLACISGDTDALALAVPLDVPRLCRLGYNADSRELYAAFDLGLSPDTERFPSTAAFSLVLYACDPAWGFRSALQHYYQLFPHCFTKRNQKEGIWMPFTDIATVQGFEDFGFQFKEGDNNVPFDAEHGIYSFIYVEPWSNWVSMPNDMPRTPEHALALVKQRADDGSARDQATFTSTLQKADGYPAIRIENQPWCDGAVFGLNPSPNVLPERPADVTQFDELIRRIDAAFERNPQLTGVYHDSFEMYLFHNFLSYRREHFRRTGIPLVFDREGRVCQFAMFTMVEFAQEIAKRMWARGGMTFANGTPHQFPWGAAWLDVMGTETAWAPSWGTFGAYQPESDSTLNYWRALCYQRPYLLLLNTRYDLWEPEWFERYMKHCTAYAAFPSMFSHNASEDPYWQTPDLYNRDRPLFKQYIPIIIALNAAGWEPITHARSDNPLVYLERFGTPPGPVYLTLLNSTGESQHARIAIDFAQLELAPSDFQPRPLLPDSRPGGTSPPEDFGLRIDLGPEDVQVFALNSFPE